LTADDRSSSERSTVPKLRTIEIKAFVPAKDFVLIDPSGVMWRIGQNVA
jgi:hypothetical protein